MGPRAWLKKCLFTSTYFVYIALALLVAECLLTSVIIQKVPYTEIDWKAYMQQIATIASGEYDYLKIRGQTGPLVYPGGFVYVFRFFYAMTEQGTDIVLAQYLYLGIYVATLAVVMAIYHKTGRSYPMLLLLLVCSRRIHSIYVLRLFNDCIAMLFLYLSIYAFVSNRWYLGSLVFSMGVSIKMNLLLFAPGLFCLFIRSAPKTARFRHPVFCLAICASFQLVVGLPFLYYHPVNYLKKAFELSRVFTYKWTVNWKILDVPTFESKSLALGLLAVQAFLLIGGILIPQFKAWRKQKRATVSAHDIVLTMFLSNFIGICCSRTLHYQFYCWYFHSLPYLLAQTKLHVVVQILLLGGIEYAFNVYPSTFSSSLVLQICHWSLLGALFYALNSHSSPTKAKKNK